MKNRLKRQKKAKKIRKMRESQKRNREQKVIKNTVNHQGNKLIAKATFSITESVMHLHKYRLPFYFYGETSAELMSLSQN